MRPVLLLLLGLLALGFASECPRKIASPGREIVCYTSAQDVQQLKNTACRCTTLVHEGHDLQDLDLARFATLRKAIKNLNPVLQFVVSISDTRGSLKTSATARQDGALRIVDILNEVDGVELNVTAGSKERLVHFVQTLKGEMKRKSKEKRLLVALPNKAEQLAKQFNIKSLSKYVDLFSLSTHYLMDDEERYRTFHPSRLMGQYDLVNTDKLVDLVHDLGADRRKILVSLPASGYKFTLKNAHENAPRDPTTQELPVEINRKDICDAVSQGPWTVERDDDSTAPYAFKDDTWIAFEDKISTGIKGKYVVLRNLAGLGIRNVENDVKSSCGKTITEEVYDSFTNNKRKSREAVLTSLKQDIYNTENLYPSNIKSSGFRISRIVDSDGKIHAVRENTQTEFSCPHQGYYVHPKSCNRFYRCVKFNQEVENYSIFEFDCPAGLAFDEQTSVCVWPGSLPEGSPCPGSPEIAPTTQQHFKCPGAGMFADPQNCRWFFACIEHDVHELRAYEFQCPYGLVFDEEKAICQWPWLVPACAGRSYEHGSAGGSGYGGGGYGKGGYGGGGEEHYGGKGEGGHGGDGGYGGGEGGDGGYGGDKNEGGYGGEGGHGGDKNEGGHAGGGEGGYGGDDKNEGGYSGGGKEGYGGDKNEGGYGGGEGGHGGDKNEGGYGGGGGYGGDKNEGGHAGGGGGRGYGGDKNEGGYGGVEGGYGGDKNEGGHAGGGEGGYGGDKNEGGYSGGGKEGYGGDKNEGGYGGVEGGYGGDKNEGGHGGGEEGGYGGDKNEGGYSEGESAHRQGGGDKSGGDKDTGHEGQGGSGGYDQSEGGYKGNSNSGQGGYEKGGEESEKREEESEGGDKNSAGSEKGEETETHDEGGAKTGGGSYDGQNQGGYDDKNTGGFNQGEYDEKEISGGSYDTKKGQDGGEDYNKNDGGYAEKGEDNSGGSEKPEGGYEGSDQGGYDGGYSGGPSKEDGGAPVPEPGIFEGDKKDESSAGSYGGDINGYGGGASEQGGGEVSYGKGSDSAGVDSGAKVEATGPTYDISPGGISTGNAAAPQSGQSILYSGYSPSPEAAHTAVSGGESLSGAGGQSAVIAGAPYTSVAGESHSIASGYYTDGSSNPNSFSTVSQRPLPTVYHDSGSAGGVTQSFGTVYTSGASGIANGGHLQSGYVEKYPQKPGYTVSNGVKTVYSGSTAPHASVYTTSSPGNGIYTHQSGASYSGGTDYSSNSAVSSGNQYYPTNPAVIYTNSGPGYTNAVPASGPDVGGYPAVVVADGSGFYTNQAGFPHNFGTSQVVPPFIPTSVTAPGNQYYPNQAGRPKKPTEVPLRPTAPSNGGYKTNEYHDNGGRGTIRYNNGVVTHKYAEDDVRDHNTAFRPFPAEEAVPETIQRTGPEYTRGGFTKTGPTKTGITTAQVGGSGTYVAGGPLRKTASGTDLIGENAFGTAPKKSAVIQQGSNVFTGAFGQSSSSRGPGPTVRPAGYAYSRPTPQFTGPATEASLNAGKKPSSEQFFNVHVYNTPTVLPSAPITAAPAVVNTYSYGRPTVGQRKDSGLSAGAASVEAHFNPQNRQPATARPPGTLDGYKSTLFEAARVPVAVSTPPPGIKTGFKVTSVTEMPIPGEIGGFDYDKYSYTHSEAGKGDGHLSIGVSLQQPTSYGFSRPSAVPVGPTGSSISSAKVGSSVSYQLPAQKEGGYEDSTRLDGGDYNYEATGGKFGEKISPAGGSASYQPVVTARPQIYKRPSSSTSTSIDSQSDVKKQSIGIKTSSKDTFNGYNYPRPTQKFSNTPETYSPVANVFPTTSTLPKITPTSTGVINNNRGNVKYTVSPYELPQNGNSAILSVETGGNKGYNYPPPPTQSSRPPGTYIKGGFTSSQPQIPQNGNSAILSVKTDANKGYNYPPPPTQSSRRPGTYIKGGFTSSQPQIPQNSAILSVETSGNKGYNYQSSSTKSFERPLNDIKGGFTPSEPVITTYSGKTSTPSYEIATKSEISKNRGKIIVKFSDLHPVLLGKLGAECTCKADPFATFRGDRPLLVDSSQGKVDLRNYDESDVYVDLDTNERETPRISGKVASQATKQAPSTYLPPTPRPRTTTTSLRVAASDIDASYSTRRSRSRGGKSLKDAKPALGGVDPDKIGVLELNPQGQAECARAGLFRHPKYCDKFYACHWDSVNNKFSLKIFNCPISLTFGSSVSACNWPTSGPTCQDDNILV